MTSQSSNVVNINEVHESNLTIAQRIADVIADFSGSITFLVVNLIAFAGWMLINTFGLLTLDRFPFLFLTMAVSLEAIFLSIFVLIAQNRQSAKDRLRSEQDYLIDVKAEQEVGRILALVQEQGSKIDFLLERTGNGK